MGEEPGRPNSGRGTADTVRSAPSDPVGFSLKLFGTLAESPGNVVYSPLATEASLHTVLPGARGKTARQIVRAPGGEIRPRFTLRGGVELAPALRALGVRDVFNPERADLAGVSPDPGLYVSAARQRAVLEVNEEGTVAAAAEMMTLVTSFEPIDPPEPPVFRADHPFYLLLYERSSRCILFLARVDDPR